MNTAAGNTGTGRRLMAGFERWPRWMGDRYDALFWHPRTEALRPLDHEYQPGEPELETEPTGF